MLKANLLGTRYPLIQSPMAGSQNLSMALAVSKAGALGSLPTATISHEQLETDLQTWQAAGRPALNVNFFAHTMPNLEPYQCDQWQNVLQDKATQYGANFDLIDFSQARKPFDAAHMALMETYRPPVVSFHFGVPDTSFIEALHDLGIQIMASATTVAEARYLEHQGVDYIIAQGLEAGGHRGIFLNMDISTQLGTMALLPQIVAAVNKPVIAAGGIASIASIQAAMKLGASAVQLGTSFLLCDESLISLAHRQALQSPQAEHTALTNIYSGRPARGLVNPLMTQLGYMHPEALPFPYAAAIISRIHAQAISKGNTDFAPMWSGQNTQGCQAISAELLTTYFCQAFTDA